MSVNPLYAKGKETGTDDDIEKGEYVRQRRFNQKEGATQRQAQGKAKRQEKRPIKSKVTLELDQLGADDTEAQLFSDFRGNIENIERHSRIQTALSSCQTASLTLFFVLIGFVCLFVVMPEIKSMSMSADIMANSSIPMAESAMHVENIAERVSNITDHVGDTVENVTESLGNALMGAGDFVEDFGKNVSGNFDGIFSAMSGVSNIFCKTFGIGCVTNASNASDHDKETPSSFFHSPSQQQDVSEDTEIKGDRFVISVVRSLSDLLLEGNGREDREGEKKEESSSYESDQEEEEKKVIDRVLSQTLQSGFSVLTTGLSSLFCGITSTC